MSTKVSLSPLSSPILCMIGNNENTTFHFLPSLKTANAVREVLDNANMQKVTLGATKKAPFTNLFARQTIGSVKPAPFSGLFAAQNKPRSQLGQAWPTAATAEEATHISLASSRHILTPHRSTTPKGVSRSKRPSPLQIYPNQNISTQAPTLTFPQKLPELYPVGPRKSAFSPVRTHNTYNLPPPAPIPRPHPTDSEKPFVCPNPKCRRSGTAFARMDELKRHQKTRKCGMLKSKEFPCDKCDQIFTRKDHLNVHQRKHTQERLYVCHYFNAPQLCRGADGGEILEYGVCEKKFGRKDDRRRHHEAVHEKRGHRKRSEEDISQIPEEIELARKERERRQRKRPVTHSAVLSVLGSSGYSSSAHSPVSELQKINYENGESSYSSGETIGYGTRGMGKAVEAPMYSSQENGAVSGEIQRLEGERAEKRARSGASESEVDVEYYVEQPVVSSRWPGYSSQF